MSLIDFSKKEIEKAGLFSKDSDYEGTLGEALMELIEVFSKQGHSGFSASMTISLFSRLADFKPIAPLTGEDDEWNEVGEGIYQNNRCPNVFKDKNGAYNSEGKIFRTPNGCTSITRDSRVSIEFPYTPTYEIIDVEEKNE